MKLVELKPSPIRIKPIPAAGEDTALQNLHSEWRPAVPVFGIYRWLEVIDRFQAYAYVITILSFTALSFATHFGPIFAIPALLLTDHFLGRSPISRTQAPPNLIDLIDLPQAVPQFPVAVFYRCSKGIYGWDAGVISFVEGWAHFQGQRTSWSIHAFDTTLTDRRFRCSLDWNYRKFRLKLEDSTVELIPYDNIPTLGPDLRSWARRAFTDWSRTTTRKPTGSLLPPTELMPDLLQRLKRSQPIIITAEWLCVVGLIVTSPGLIAGNVRPAGVVPFATVVILLAGLSFLRLKNTAILKRARRPPNPSHPTGVERGGLRGPTSGRSDL